MHAGSKCLRSIQSRINMGALVKRNDFGADAVVHGRQRNTRSGGGRRKRTGQRFQCELQSPKQLNRAAKQIMTMHFLQKIMSQTSHTDGRLTIFMVFQPNHGNSMTAKRRTARAPGA